MTLEAGSFEIEPLSIDQTQYNLGKITFTSNESVAASLPLKRVPLYHLTNTYMPMLTLIVIVELTLFFKAHQLEMALGFSLTIMLVMYTFYQSVSASVPKTAYLKFIDYWLIFCLIVPIAVFLSVIGWIFFINNQKKVCQKSIPREKSDLVLLKMVCPFKR